MVRLATVNDAAQLEILNNEFNGKGETTFENIEKSLLGNQQEIVIVDEEDGIIVGFVCVQLKKSFCYDEYMPEITELHNLYMTDLDIRMTGNFICQKW